MAGEGAAARMRGSTEGEEEKTKYKGIRVRKWGRWVAEIRAPNKGSRIWLGSYDSPVAAARAYDAAVYCLRGPTARLNFPELAEEFTASTDATGPDMTVDAVKKAAAAVGARLDVLQVPHPLAATADIAAAREVLDLNEMPKADN